MTVPYTFANATGNISLSELDVNFANVKAAADTAGTANTVTGNAQANITCVGMLTALSVAGNVTAGNFIGTLAGVVSNAGYANQAGSAATANTVTYAAQTNITSVGVLTSLSVSGNIVAGNINGTWNTDYANAAGTANTANTAATVTTAAQPNITSVGILTSLSVSGNINTGVGTIAASAISGDVNSAIYAIGANSVLGNAQPNITSVGLLSSVTVSGNVTGGNIISSGKLSISGITTLGVSNASAITAITGHVGDIVAISDSPTVAGRLAFWDTTNTRWSYVSDNSAV